MSFISIEFGVVAIKFVL